jgi:DNA-binding transcriptional MocR family regulator
VIRARHGLLRARLEAGEWAPGERLPSVATLAAEYGVGHGTVRRALSRLQDEGWLTTLPRYGIFRSRRTPSDQDPAWCASPGALPCQVALRDQGHTVNRRETLARVHELRGDPGRDAR